MTCGHIPDWLNTEAEKLVVVAHKEFMPFLYHDCKKMILLPDIGYYYYQRIESASHGTGTDDKRFTDSVHIRKKHIQFYQEIGEQELAEAAMKLLIELIITSDCNGWIPEHAQTSIREDFLTYAKMLAKSKTVSNKCKLRYLIYAVFGTNTYRRFVLKKRIALSK